MRNKHTTALRGVRRGWLSKALVASTVLAAVATWAANAPNAGAAKKAAGTPLTFGIVGTNTGGSGIGQDGQAFEAYVANWNAHGGYKGHPIHVIDLDGALDPTATANAARTLVDADNVIALVNNYSFLDCTINNTFYAANKVAVMGGGTSSCYLPTTDFPGGKLGGSGGLSDLVKYAASIGAKNIGLVYPNFTGIQEVISGSQAEAASLKVKFSSYMVPLIPAASDFDTVIQQMKTAGVDTVLSLSQGPTGELLLQEAANANFGVANHIRYMFGPTEYDPTIAKALAGAYVYTYGLPWTSNVPAAKQALKILQQNHVSKIDGFAEGGYQTAAEFQQVLDSVKGPVTRASFLKAIEHATSISVPLTPSSYKVNLANPKVDPVGGYVVKAEHGNFTLVSGFIVTNH